MNLCLSSQVLSSGSLRTAGEHIRERTGFGGWPGMRTCVGSLPMCHTPRWIAIIDVSSPFRVLSNLLSISNPTCMYAMKECSEFYDYLFIINSLHHAHFPDINTPHATYSNTYTNTIDQHNTNQHDTHHQFLIRSYYAQCSFMLCI